MFGCFGCFGAVLGCFRGCFEVFWLFLDVLVFFGCFWVLSGVSGCFWVFLDVLGPKKYAKNIRIQKQVIKMS